MRLISHALRSITISDGVESAKAMLSPKYNEMCKDGRMASGALVKITEASCVAVSDSRCARLTVRAVRRTHPPRTRKRMRGFLAGTAQRLTGIRASSC